jgi:hypothetical protein
LRSFRAYETARDFRDRPSRLRRPPKAIPSTAISARPPNATSGRLELAQSSILAGKAGQMFETLSPDEDGPVKNVIFLD